MNQEMERAARLELDAYGYLEKKLAGLSDQIAKAVSKKSQQQEAREMALTEYKTEQDIQDAYGWDFITEAERDRLLDRLRGAEEKAGLPFKEKIALEELKSIISNVRRIKAELEYELLTDEEKEQRQKRNEEFQNKMSEIRARRGR